MSAKQGMVLVVFFGLILSLGSVVYTSQVVSEMKTFRIQYKELLGNHSQLQEMYKNQVAESAESQRRYVGNPFGTELWPGQIQSENITGMHWYSYYEGALLNCTDNVLGLGGVELEGDYTTWTHVWTRDYGEGVNIDGFLVNNTGTVYSWDSSAEHAFVRTFDGVETNHPEDYVFGMMVYPIWQEHSSILNRYVIAQDSSGFNIVMEVWKDGAVVWSREPVLDEPLFIWSDCVGMSPSGEYMAIGGLSSATMDSQLVLLYRGS